MLVILVGFMGAGKSSLLKKWGQDFRGAANDLDDLIAKQVGVETNKLGDWIRQIGLEKFREIETQELLKIINNPGEQLLSLGGGAFHKKNRELLKRQGEDAQCVWIESSVEECWRRVKGDANRPLACGGYEDFKKLYEERLEDYKQAKYRLSGEKDFPSWEIFCKKYKIPLLMD